MFKKTNSLCWWLHVDICYLYNWYILLLGCCIIFFIYWLIKWCSQLAKITIPPIHPLYLIPSSPTGWTNCTIKEVHISKQNWRQIFPCVSSIYFLWFPKENFTTFHTYFFQILTLKSIGELEWQLWLLYHTFLLFSTAPLILLSTATRKIFSHN